MDKRHLNIIGIILMSMFILYMVEQVYKPEKMNIYHYKTFKILDTASPYTIQTLDPAHVEDRYSSQAIAKVYEGLLTYNPLGDTDTMRLVPNLAAEMPTISPDGLVYTFKIKQDVKFHPSFCFSWKYTSRELNANDFVYSIKRIADKKTKSPNFILLSNRIKGLDAWREQNADQESVDYTMVVEGIQALDKYTLQFILNTPWPQFLDVLAMPFCSVVPYEAIMYYGEAFPQNPIGTGPFVLPKVYQGASELFFSRYYNFRKKKDPAKESVCRSGNMPSYSSCNVPFVDKVVTHIMPSEEDRLLKFQRAGLDILDLQNASILRKKSIQDHLLSPNLKKIGASINRKKMQLISHYFVFNCNQAPFKDNIKLRQAMSMAFDREQYNTLFFNNTGIIPQMFIPPNLPGYQEDYTNSYSYHDNLKKARQYLLEAGYAGGKGLPIIVLDTIVGTTYRKQAEFFMECMKKIGIKVHIISNMYPVLQQKIRDGITMIHALSIASDYLNDSFLYLLRNTTNRHTTASYQNALYTLYTQMIASKEAYRKQNVYKKLNKFVEKNMPMICAMYEWDDLSIEQSWVINYVQSGVYLDKIEQYIDINKEGKQKGKEQEMDRLRAQEAERKKKIKEDIARQRRKEKQEQEQEQEQKRRKNTK